MNIKRWLEDHGVIPFATSWGITWMLVMISKLLLLLSFSAVMVVEGKTIVDRLQPTLQHCLGRVISLPPTFLLLHLSVTEPLVTDRARCNRVVLTRSGHADDVRKTLEDSDGSLSHRPTSTARSPHLRRFPARRA